MKRSKAPSIRSAAKQLGVSHPTLLDRIKRGKVTWPPVSIEALKREWDQNKNSLQSRRANPAPAPAAGEDESGIPSQAVSERKLAAIKSQNADLDLRKKQGKLIDVTEVEKHWAQVGIQLRNTVMGIPAQLVNRLPLEWRREVLAVAQDEVRAVLTALSDELRRAEC